MQRIIIIAFLAFYSFSCPQAFSWAKVLAPADEEPIILRAPILRESEIAEYHSFADELAIKIQSALEELGLEGVVVAILVDASSTASLPLEEQEKILEYEELLPFDEVLVVKEATIFQQATIYGEPSSPLFYEFGCDGATSSSAKGVQTTIALHADFYNIAADEYLGSLQLRAEHRDGNGSRSKNGAMKKWERKLILELRRIYFPAADVLTADDGELVLAMGKKQGVHERQYFQIIAPDRTTGQGKDAFLVDGGAVGVGIVRQVGDDTCRVELMRQWGEHTPGSWALLRADPLFAIELAVTPSLFSDYLNYALRFHGGPERALDWGGGVNIIRIRDSQDHNDYGFGFDGFAQWRFRNGRRFNWSITGGLDLDLPFRKDDEGNIVSTMLFSLYGGASGEILLSAKTDLIVTFGYRRGVKNSDWEYSAEDASYPAYWQGRAPRVDNSGWMLSVGYRWLF